MWVGFIQIVESFKSKNLGFLKKKRFSGQQFQYNLNYRQPVCPADTHKHTHTYISHYIYKYKLIHKYILYTHNRIYN